MCPSTFTVRYNLARHLKNVHAIFDEGNEIESEDPGGGGGQVMTSENVPPPIIGANVEFGNEHVDQIDGLDNKNEDKSCNLAAEQNSQEVVTTNIGVTQDHIYPSPVPQENIPVQPEPQKSVKTNQSVYLNEQTVYLKEGRADFDEEMSGSDVDAGMNGDISDDDWSPEAEFSSSKRTKKTPKKPTERKSLASSAKLPKSMQILDNEHCTVHVLAAENIPTEKIKTNVVSPSSLESDHNKSNDELREPMNKNKTEFQCKLCDYKVSNNTLLTDHIRSVHEGIRYPCDQCDDYVGKSKEL